jgi:hypothetical protein
MRMQAIETWERVPEYNIGSRANYSCDNKSIVRGLAYHRRVYGILFAHCDVNPGLGLDFVEEPWMRCIAGGKRRMRQPDGILLDNFTNSGIVIEVKLNWKDGRDEKLINTYLAAARSAFGLTTTWPLLITKNIRGYGGTVLLGLRELERCFEWRPGQSTPVMLIP